MLSREPEITLRFKLHHTMSKITHSEKHKNTQLKEKSVAGYLCHVWKARSLF